MLILATVDNRVVLIGKALTPVKVINVGAIISSLDTIDQDKSLLVGTDNSTIKLIDLRTFNSTDFAFPNLGTVVKIIEGMQKVKGLQTLVAVTTESTLWYGNFDNNLRKLSFSGYEVSLGSKQVISI